MTIIDVVGITTLVLFPLLPFIALVLSMLSKNEVRADGKKVLGNGPRCDICGDYLSSHDMYQCETYC